MLPSPLTHMNAYTRAHIPRYQAAYRELALKHPSFRARSETTELIVDISLQVTRTPVALWCFDWRVASLSLRNSWLCTHSGASRWTCGAGAAALACACVGCQCQKAQQLEGGGQRGAVARQPAPRQGGRGVAAVMAAGAAAEATPTAAKSAAAVARPAPHAYPMTSSQPVPTPHPPPPRPRLQPALRSRSAASALTA
jgi:hypothetical protein